MKDSHRTYSQRQLKGGENLKKNLELFIQQNIILQKSILN